MKIIARSATRIAFALSLVLGVSAILPSSAAAVVFCQKKGKIKVRAESCKPKEVMVPSGGSPLEARMAAVEDEVGRLTDDLIALGGAVSTPEVFSVGVDPATDLEPMTLSIRDKSFCALGKVQLSIADGGIRYRWCQLTALGGGDWSLEARTEIGEAVFCEAICF